MAASAGLCRGDPGAMTTGGDILERILTVKAVEVEAGRAETGVDELRARSRELPPVRDFAGALAAGATDPPAVIAEIKRASPSAGLIRSDFDPVWLAGRYAAGGAACLSVLTDRQFFRGHPEFLAAARAACRLPVLRKDFVIDPWQVWETRAMGADALLLIVAALDDGRLADLHGLAGEAGLAVLVEVHDAGELDRALGLKGAVLGVNNRNLRTFETDLAVSEVLKERAGERRLVAESGIRNRVDIRRLRRADIHAFLVGESLMRAGDPGVALAELVG